MNRTLRLEILKRFNTQGDFANAAGEHDTKVSMVLHGRRKLSVKQAKRWGKVLRCDPKILKTVTKEA
jgi:antitoxin component HigA of HigAB toxin-antitoxin module